MKIYLLVLCVLSPLVKADIRVTFDNGKLVVEWDEETYLGYIPTSYFVDVKLLDGLGKEFNVSSVSVPRHNTSHSTTFKDIEYFPATVYSVTLKCEKKSVRRSLYTLDAIDHVTEPTAPVVTNSKETSCSNNTCFVHFFLENAQTNSTQYIFASTSDDQYIITSIKEKKDLSEVGLLEKRDVKNGVIINKIDKLDFCDSNITFVFANIFHGKSNYTLFTVPKINCLSGRITGNELDESEGYSTILKVVIVVTIIIVILILAYVLIPLCRFLLKQLRLGDEITDDVPDLPPRSYQPPTEKLKTFIAGRTRRRTMSSGSEEREIMPLRSDTWLDV